LNRIFFDIETYGNTLDNMYIGKVISIGYKLNDENIIILKEWEKSEKEILKIFFNLLEKYNKSLLIGFNDLHFDIPYLINRANKNKIGSLENLLQISSNFYNIDLIHSMLYLNNFYYLGLSSFNIDKELKLNCYHNHVGGDEITNLYNNKEFEIIEHHNKEDVFFTEKLYYYLCKQSK
jgi:DNA polymerase elongation subunit (family B)